MCLQINKVKYDANWEITNIYENLQIVWSQFCTDKLLFVYIQSTSNINWFIGIRIHCQQVQMNSYSVTFGYTQYLVQHLMNNPEGKKTTICCYLQQSKLKQKNFTLLIKMQGLGFETWDYFIRVGWSASTRSDDEELLD